MWYLVLGSFALVFFVFALAKVTEVQPSRSDSPSWRLRLNRSRLVHPQMPP